MLDALSRLLALYPVHVVLDYRCRLGAPWRLDEPAVGSGVAPYHLIVDGDAWLGVGDEEEVLLHAGDIVVLPHGTAHSLRMQHGAALQPAQSPQPPHIAPGPQVVRKMINDAAGPATDILCGRFVADKSAPHALLNMLPPLILIRTAGRPELAAMRTLITLLRDETETIQPGAEAVASHLASALFSMVIRAWLQQKTGASGLFALLADHRLPNALKVMLSEPAGDWTVETLAHACHVSRATFARLFRQCSGATPGEILARTRMAQAAQWLAQGRRSTVEIGEAVGYKSEAAFNRMFKRTFGVGPGQYRRMQRK